MPAKKQRQATIARPVTRIAVGKRGTSPVWTYVTTSGSAKITAATASIAPSEPK